MLIRKFLLGENTLLLLSSDETVVSKSGKKTIGIDYFFSSVLQKSIKSLCFSGLSVIAPDKNKSYPLMLNQLIFTPEEKEVSKQKKEKKIQSKGKKVGRPKGSKNKKDKFKDLAPTFKLLKEQLTKVKQLFKLNVLHFVGDGKYGNNTCLNICKEFSISLISKLQYNSELYFQNTEPYKGIGRHKKYLPNI